MLSAYLKRNTISSGDRKAKDRIAHYELRTRPIPSLNLKDYPPNTILVPTPLRSAVAIYVDLEDVLHVLNGDVRLHCSVRYPRYVEDLVMKRLES